MDRLIKVIKIKIYIINYLGEFSKQNKFEGKGRLDSEFSLYEGDFVKQKKCGEGIEHFKGISIILQV